MQIAPSEVSDQTVRMHWLICIFDGRTCPNVRLLKFQLKLFYLSVSVSLSLSLSIIHYIVFKFTFRVRVPKRSMSKKLTVRGMFEQSKVKRGPNWRWQNQDGRKLYAKLCF